MKIFRNEASTLSDSWSFKYDNNPNLEFIITQQFFSDCKNPRTMNKIARQFRLQYTEAARQDNTSSPPRKERNEKKAKSKDIDYVQTTIMFTTDMLQINRYSTNTFKKKIRSVTESGLFLADKWDAFLNEEKDDDNDEKINDQSWVKEDRSCSSMEKTWKWNAKVYAKYFDESYDFSKADPENGYDDKYLQLRQQLNVKLIFHAFYNQIDKHVIKIYTGSSLGSTSIRSRRSLDATGTSNPRLEK